MRCDDNSSFASASLDTFLQKMALVGVREDGSEQLVNNSTATHYSLNGGKYCINIQSADAAKLDMVNVDDNAEFLKLYTMAIMVNKLVCLVERRTTRTFLMYFDIDIIDHRDIQIEELLETYLRTIQRVIVSFYDNNTPASRFQCIVLSAPIKAVTQSRASTSSEQGGQETVQCEKSGFHLHWPNLVVDENIALLLRYNIVLALEQEQQQPRAWPQNSIDDIVDECVFTKNGLRMVGSDKMKQCTAPGCTKGLLRRGYPCTTCVGKGRVPEGRAYTLRAAFTKTMEPDEAYFMQMYPASAVNGGERVNKILTLVQRCSIRTMAELTPGFAPPDIGVMSLPKRSTGAFSKRDEFAYTDVGGRSSDLSKCLQMVLRQSVHTAYANLSISQVAYQKGSARMGRSYKVKVNALSQGSCYCQNVQRAHKSSQVYFIFSERRGLSQRCWSQKYNCKMYHSPSVTIPEALHRALFPVEDDILLAEELDEDNERKQNAKCIMSNILTDKTMSSCFSQVTQRNATKRSYEELLDGDEDEYEILYLEKNGKWKPVDLKMRALNKTASNGAIQGISTNCNYSWDELDKMSTRALISVDAKRAKNDKAAQIAMQKSAVRATTELKRVIETAHSATQSTDPNAKISPAILSRFFKWTRPRNPHQ